MAASRVLLLVTGGIAAYKACFLTRLLVQAGFSVKVAMTDAAQRFVAPLTFQALSNHAVASDLWGEGQSEAMDHIEYARWAEIAVVAPATANLLAKAAHGIADDIVTTLLLAFRGPVLLAPAMNDNMWRHPATQANLATLHERGVRSVGPGAGDLACGTVDIGRMAEPEEILAAVRGIFFELAEEASAGAGPGGAAKVPNDAPAAARVSATGAAAAAPAPWRGQRVVVTAGPTHEPIDPVRYLANRSSGVFGHAIARAAVRAGARVTLITGPTAVLPPRGLAHLVRVETAREMADAVAAALGAGADWLIMNAAVADFTPVQPATAKIKRDELGHAWHLDLVRTPDILCDVVPPKRQPETRVVGFALETENLIEHARAKLAAKGLDFIVANDPTGSDGTFGAGLHRVRLLGPAGEIWASDMLPKDHLAAELLARLADAARRPA